MLSYLQVSTQPEIPMAVHQCAPFFNNPRLLHERAIIRITKYLVSTSTYVDLQDGNQWLTTCGVFYSLYKEKYIYYYLDADFSGVWFQADADNA